MNTELLSISDLGNYELSIDKKRKWKLDFIINNGELVIISHKLFSNGVPIDHFLQNSTSEITYHLQDKWLRFDCTLDSYSVILSYVRNNRYKILYLFKHFRNNDTFQQDIEFKRVLIGSPLINRFFLDKSNLRVLKNLNSNDSNDTYRIISKSLYKFNLNLKVENSTSKNIVFDIFLKSRTINNPSHLELNDSMEANILFSFSTCQTNDSFTFEEIRLIKNLVSEFISFISFERTDEIECIDLLTSDHRYNLLFSNDQLENINPHLRRIVNFSDIKRKGMQTIMQSLLNHEIRTRLLYPIVSGFAYDIDILRLSSVLEQEVSLNAKYKTVSLKTRKGIDYETIDKFVKSHKNSLKKEFIDDFNSAIGVFEKFDGRLANKLKFSHEFLLSFYDSKPKVDTWEYITNEKVVQRIKNVRHGIAHDLKEEKYTDWQPRDVFFLQAMVYALILKRLKLPKPTIQVICFKIFEMLEFEFIQVQTKHRKR